MSYNMGCPVNDFPILQFLNKCPIEVLEQQL